MWSHSNRCLNNSCNKNYNEQFNKWTQSSHSAHGCIASRVIPKKTQNHKKGTKNLHLLSTKLKQQNMEMTQFSYITVECMRGKRNCNQTGVICYDIPATSRWAGSSPAGKIYPTCRTVKGQVQTFRDISVDRQTDTTVSNSVISQKLRVARLTPSLKQSYDLHEIQLT